MEKNLPFQTIGPLPPTIKVPSQLWVHLRASTGLFGKKWYYGTNLQAIGFLVTSKLGFHDLLQVTLVQ